MSEEKTEIAKIIGPEHTYEFEIMDTLTGIGLMHEYLTHFGSNIDEITAGVAKVIGTSEDIKDLDSVVIFRKLISGDDVFIKLRNALISALGMTELFRACADLLGGAKINGEKCDELGMCKVFRGKPHEVYTALIMAMAANYPDYFPFLQIEVVTEESR